MFFPLAIRRGLSFNQRMTGREFLHITLRCFLFAAEKAYEQLAGKAVEKDIRIPVQLVTKENADEFLK